MYPETPKQEQVREPLNSETSRRQPQSSSKCLPRELNQTHIHNRYKETMYNPNQTPTPKTVFPVSIRNKRPNQHDPPFPFKFESNFHQFTTLELLVEMY